MSKPGHDEFAALVIESMLQEVQDFGLNVGDYVSDRTANQCDLLGYAKRAMAIEPDKRETAAEKRELLRVFRAMGFTSLNDVVNYNDSSSTEKVIKLLKDSLKKMTESLS